MNELLKGCIKLGLVNLFIALITGQTLVIFILSIIELIVILVLYLLWNLNELHTISKNRERREIELNCRYPKPTEYLDDLICINCGGVEFDVVRHSVNHIGRKYISCKNCRDIQEGDLYELS